MRHYSAFSLPKTLLVVGVLFVVAPVLFGKFGRSRGTDPPPSCQSNLKQILLGFTQYRQDYDELYPPLDGRNLPETKPASSGWVNSLQPYVKNFWTFQCPAESNNIIGRTDYAYNCGPFAVDYPLVPPHPSRTVILCEIDESEGALASASAPVVLTRHLQGSNYAFADGHTKWLGVPKAPWPSNMAATESNFTFGT